MESSQIRFFFICSLKLCMYIETTRSQKGKVHIQRLNCQFHQFCWSDFFILVINSQSLKNRIPKIVEAHLHNSIFVFSVCHKVLPYSLSIVLIRALKMSSAVLFAFIICKDFRLSSFICLFYQNTLHFSSRNFEKTGWLFDSVLFTLEKENYFY